MAQELVGTPGIFSYDLTVETPIDIDDMIYMLSPTDLPLLQGINADGFPVLPSKPTGDTTYYWLEEEVPLPRGVTAEALDTSETDITMATGDAVKFAVGDGIRINDEIMLVTAVDTSTEVLTVTRGSATVSNTTVGSHASGDEVIGIGTILIEGALGGGNFQGRDKYSNICQIFSGTVKMSRTEQLIKKYGISSEWVHQLANRIQHHAVGMEQAFLYGKKFQHASNYRRQTGGLYEGITTNVDSTSTWLTVDSIETQQQAAFNAGGMFDMLIAKPGAFAALNNITGTERVSSQTFDDPRRGRRRAQSVETEFGVVTLVRNRWARASHAFGVTRGQFSRRVLRPMVVEKLGRTDDTDTSSVIVECGAQLKGEAHAAKWTALSASAEMPMELI